MEGGGGPLGILSPHARAFRPTRAGCTGSRPRQGRTWKSLRSPDVPPPKRPGTRDVGNSRAWERSPVAWRNVRQTKPARPASVSSSSIARGRAFVPLGWNRVKESPPNGPVPTLCLFSRGDGCPSSGCGRIRPETERRRVARGARREARGGSGVGGAPADRAERDPGGTPRRGLPVDQGPWTRQERE